MLPPSLYVRMSATVAFIILLKFMRQVLTSLRITLISGLV
jgi:hypothetical protein